jgi:2-polyprenyl-3-methyl-5-hydroxy-6-metoxy-1,4-benzoquinol methylase
MTEKLPGCPVCGNVSAALFLETRDHFLTGEEFSIQQCNGCGFRFIRTRPDIDEIGRYYQSDDYISHDAKSASLISRIYKLARFFSVRNKYKIVSNYLDAGRILDIGCGTGEFLKHCRSKGLEVAGVEPNEKAGNFAHQVNGIQVTGKLAGLSPDQAPFNCITMWHVLEHLHDLNESVEMVRKMLSPDGVFIVAVPNCNSWDAERYGKYWAAYDVPRHLYHFTEKSIQALLKNHGFEIIKMLPQKLDSFYVSMLSEKYQTGRNNYIKAVFYGMWSNFQAGRKGRGHSSQIFVLSLKKA